MDKYIFILVVLLFLPLVSATNYITEYKTWVNITMVPANFNSTNQCGNVTLDVEGTQYYFEGNSSINSDYLTAFNRNVDCDNIDPQFSNFTNAISALVDSNQNFVTWCGDQKAISEKYTVSYGDGSAKQKEVDLCNEALRICNVKADQLPTCQGNLLSRDTIVTSKQTEIDTCKIEKEGMSGDWKIAGFFGLLIGALVAYIITNRMKTSKDIKGSWEPDMKNEMR